MWKLRLLGGTLAKFVPMVLVEKIGEAEALSRGDPLFFFRYKITFGQSHGVGAASLKKTVRRTLAL